MVLFKSLQAQFIPRCSRAAVASRNATHLECDVRFHGKAD